jgi:hypothetical protein
VQHQTGHNAGLKPKPGKSGNREGAEKMSEIVTIKVMGTVTDDSLTIEKVDFDGAEKPETGAEAAVLLSQIQDFLKNRIA